MPDPAFRPEVLDRIADSQIHGTAMPYGLRVVATYLTLATPTAAHYTVVFRDVAAGTGFWRFSYRHNHAIGEVASTSEATQVYAHTASVIEYREYAA